MEQPRTFRQHRLKIAWLAILLVMVLTNVAAQSSTCSLDEESGDCCCPSELAFLSPFVAPPTLPRLAPSAPSGPLVLVEAQPLALTRPVPPAAPPLVFAPKTSPPA